jgi:hypothetical protein
MTPAWLPRKIIAKLKSTKREKKQRDVVSPWGATRRDRDRKI